MTARRLTVPLLAGALLLTACSGLPTSSTVEPGLPVAGAPVQGPQALPDGPEKDAAPDEILTGFLMANVSFDDDHEVARQFLTADLAKDWRPTERVVVYQGDPQLDMTREGEVVATVTAIGEIDEQGYLTQLPENSRRSATFTMARVSGQWRITTFPEGFGVWLTESDFIKAYRSADVTYLAPERKVIVPDRRWFPLGAGLVTALARAQTDGVPDYLRGAVVDAVPKGVELAASAVPVDPTTGVATVDLRGAGSLTAPDQQNAVLAQFTQTLMQAQGVKGVTVLSEGREIQAEPVVGPTTSASQVGYDPSVSTVRFALRRRTVELQPVNPYFYQLSDYVPGPDDVPVPQLPIVPVRWQHLASDATVNDLAGVSADGRTLARWQDGRLEEMGGIGTSLTPPSYDRVDGLWVAGDAKTGPRVWWIDTDEPASATVAKPVKAPWLPGEARILQFQVGPDDQRAVIHWQDRLTDAHHLGLTGIVRDSDGVPISLTDPMPIGGALESVATVSWSSSSQVVVLGRQPQDIENVPYVLNLGGWMEALRSESDSVQLKGVPAVDGQAVVLVDARGRLFTQERDDWYNASLGDDLIVPGN